LTICYTIPEKWCELLQFRPYNNRNFQVVIPGVNGGHEIDVIDDYGKINTKVKYALGCNGFPNNAVWGRLNRYYVSAQLDIQNAVPFWWAKVKTQTIKCHLAPMNPNMPMMGMVSPLPLTLSNGVVITETSSIADLFAATNWAVGRGGTVDDQSGLLAIYKALNTCHKD
jgi:hypothetical protein